MEVASNTPPSQRKGAPARSTASKLKAYEEVAKSILQEKDTLKALTSYRDDYLDVYSQIRKSYLESHPRLQILHSRVELHIKNMQNSDPCLVPLTLQNQKDKSVIRKLIAKAKSNVSFGEYSRAEADILQLRIVLDEVKVQKTSGVIPLSVYARAEILLLEAKIAYKRNADRSDVGSKITTIVEMLQHINEAANDPGLDLAWANGIKDQLFSFYFEIRLNGIDIGLSPDHLAWLETPQNKSLKDALKLYTHSSLRTSDSLEEFNKIYQAITDIDFPTITYQLGQALLNKFNAFEAGNIVSPLQKHRIHAFIQQMMLPDDGYMMRRLLMEKQALPLTEKREVAKAENAWVILEKILSSEPGAPEKGNYELLFSTWENLLSYTYQLKKSGGNRFSTLLKMMKGEDVADPELIELLPNDLYKTTAGNLQTLFKEMNSKSSPHGDLWGTKIKILCDRFDPRQAYRQNLAGICDIDTLKTWHILLKSSGKGGGPLDGIRDRRLELLERIINLSAPDPVSRAFTHQEAWLYAMEEKLYIQLESRHPDCMSETIRSMAIEAPERLGTLFKSFLFGKEGVRKIMPAERSSRPLQEVIKRTNIKPTAERIINYHPMKKMHFAYKYRELASLSSYVNNTVPALGVHTGSQVAKLQLIAAILDATGMCSDLSRSQLRAHEDQISRNLQPSHSAILTPQILEDWSKLTAIIDQHGKETFTPEGMVKTEYKQVPNDDSLRDNYNKILELSAPHVILPQDSLDLSVMVSGNRKEVLSVFLEDALSADLKSIKEEIAKGLRDSPSASEIKDAVQKYMLSNYRYLRDLSHYWQTPEETLGLKQGACHDLAVLQYALTVQLLRDKELAQEAAHLKLILSTDQSPEDDVSTALHVQMVDIHHDDISVYEVSYNRKNEKDLDQFIRETRKRTNTSGWLAAIGLASPEKDNNNICVLQTTHPHSGELNNKTLEYDYLTGSLSFGQTQGDLEASEALQPDGTRWTWRENPLGYNQLMSIKEAESFHGSYGLGGGRSVDWDLHAENRYLLGDEKLGFAQINRENVEIGNERVDYPFGATSLADLNIAFRDKEIDHTSTLGVRLEESETKSNQSLYFSRDQSLGNNFNIRVGVGASRRDDEFALWVIPATLQWPDLLGHHMGRVPPPPVLGQPSTMIQKDQRTYGSAEFSLGYENDDFAFKTGLSAETKSLFFDSEGNVLYLPSLSTKFEADVKNLWGGVLSIGGQLKSAKDGKNKELTEFIHFLRPLSEKTDLVVGLNHDSYSTKTPVGSETTGDTISVGIMHNLSPHVKLSSAISYYLSRFSSDANDAGQVKPTLESVSLVGTAHATYTFTELLAEMGISDSDHAFLKAFGFEGKELRLSEKNRAVLKLKSEEAAKEYLCLLESIKANLQAQGVQVDNIPRSTLDDIRLYAALQACLTLEGEGFMNTLVGMSYTHGTELGGGWLVNALSMDINPFSENGFGPGWRGEYSKPIGENAVLHLEAGLNILRAYGSASVEFKEPVDKCFKLLLPKVMKDWIPNISVDVGTRVGFRTTSSDTMKYSAIYLSAFEGLKIIPRGEDFFGGKRSSLTFSFLPAPGTFIPMFFYYSADYVPGTYVTLFDRTLVSRYRDNYKIFIPNKKAYPQAKIEEETISKLSEFSRETCTQVCMNEPSDKKFIDKIIKGKETFHDFLNYMEENLDKLTPTKIQTINLAEEETNFIGDTLSLSKKDLKKLLVDVAEIKADGDRKNKFREFLESIPSIHQARRDDGFEGREILAELTDTNYPDNIAQLPRLRQSLNALLNTGIEMILSKSQLQWLMLPNSSRIDQFIKFLDYLVGKSQMNPAICNLVVKMDGDHLLSMFSGDTSLSEETLRITPDLITDFHVSSEPKAVNAEKTLVVSPAMDEELDKLNLPETKKGLSILCGLGVNLYYSEDQKEDAYSQLEHFSKNLANLESRKGIRFSSDFRAVAGIELGQLQNLNKFIERILREPVENTFHLGQLLLSDDQSGLSGKTGIIEIPIRKLKKDLTKKNRYVLGMIETNPLAKALKKSKEKPLQVLDKELNKVTHMQNFLEKRLIAKTPLQPYSLTVEKVEKDSEGGINLKIVGKDLTDRKSFNQLYTVLIPNLTKAGEDILIEVKDARGAMKRYKLKELDAKTQDDLMAVAVKYVVCGANDSEHAIAPYLLDQKLIKEYRSSLVASDGTVAKMTAPPAPKLTAEPPKKKQRYVYDYAAEVKRRERGDGAFV